MINATDIRRGMILKMDDGLYQVFDFTHITPGKGRAFVQTKLRNLESGVIKDYRFRSSDRVEKAFLDSHEMQYMYNDGEFYYFMNNETFEQISLSREYLGDGIYYLKPDTIISMQFHEKRPLGVQLPASVELEVVETEPAVKNATVSNVTKPATTETGLVVQVPPFINSGETIKVNTETGEYISRA